MPDPPIMPSTASSTASAMTAPVGLTIPPTISPRHIQLLSFGSKVFSQPPHFARQRADVLNERPRQTPVDHRRLPANEQPWHQPGHLRQHQPAGRRRNAD